MQKILTLAALISAATFNAQAADHTFSLGYAQTDIKQFNDPLHGVTLKYRYEGHSPVGFIASWTGTADVDTFSRVDPGPTLTTVSETTRSYSSLHVGPTFRFSPLVSSYATLGYSDFTIESKVVGAGTSKIEDENFAIGGGFEFNVTRSFAVNTGVEYTEHLSDSRTLTYSLALGYRF